MNDLKLTISVHFKHKRKKKIKKPIASKHILNLQYSGHQWPLSLMSNFNKSFMKWQYVFFRLEFNISPMLVVISHYKGLHGLGSVIVSFISGQQFPYRYFIQWYTCKQYSHGCMVFGVDIFWRFLISDDIISFRTFLKTEERIINWKASRNFFPLSLQKLLESVIIKQFTGIVTNLIIGILKRSLFSFTRRTW